MKTTIHHGSYHGQYVIYKLLINTLLTTSLLIEQILQQPSIWFLFPPTKLNPLYTDDFMEDPRSYFIMKKEKPGRESSFEAFVTVKSLGNFCLDERLSKDTEPSKRRTMVPSDDFGRLSNPEEIFFFPDNGVLRINIPPSLSGWEGEDSLTTLNHSSPSSFSDDPLPLIHDLYHLWKDQDWSF